VNEETFVKTDIYEEEESERYDSFNFHMKQNNRKLKVYDVEPTPEKLFKIEQ